MGWRRVENCGLGVIVQGGERGEGYMDIIVWQCDIIAVLIQNFKGNGIIIELWTDTGFAGGVYAIYKTYVDHWYFDGFLVPLRQQWLCR